MQKEVLYRRLVEDAKASYLANSSDLKWCNDCNEINFWTYWQGRDHLDARILLVGQDWGCLWDSSSAPTLERIRQMNQGISVPYVEKCHSSVDKRKVSFTDQSLIELFDSIGFDICKDDPRLFFTNFVLGYRQKGTSGNFQKQWAKQDAVFFFRLAEIIKPHIILCLGKDTFEAVLSSFSYQLPHGSLKNFNHFIECEQNPVSVSYVDGTPAYVFALAHCGVMGTLNRNRGTKKGDSLDVQKADWQRILPFLT